MEICLDHHENIPEFQATISHFFPNAMNILARFRETPLEFFISHIFISPFKLAEKSKVNFPVECSPLNINFS